MTFLVHWLEESYEKPLTSVEAIVLDHAFLSVSVEEPDARSGKTDNEDGGEGSSVAEEDVPGMEMGEDDLVESAGGSKEAVEDCA